MNENQSNNETPKITRVNRRGFLKTAALTSAGVLLHPHQYARADQPETSILTPHLPGDFIVRENQPQQVLENKAEISSLPEKSSDNRSWRKIECPSSPPPSYRSACCYSQKRDSFILHGGFGYGSNHNQTWEIKENSWQKIEAGSTLNLHGHKMVETPQGLLVFGGVKLLPGGGFDISDKFYLLNEQSNIWEEIQPDKQVSQKIPGLQAMGMVYHPETESVWIFGGAVGKDVFLSDSTFCLMLPNNYYSRNWYFTGMGYTSAQNFYQVFEPLAYVKPGDQSLYLYGGQGYDRGGGLGVYSNDHWQISLDNTNIKVLPSSIPRTDYAGAMRGGYDNKRKQVVLHAGNPTFFFSYPYDESVEYDESSKKWLKINSAVNPEAMGRPAVAMNPQTGEMLRFGGSFYDQNGIAQWSAETWMCSPLYRSHLPSVQK